MKLVLIEDQTMIRQMLVIACRQALPEAYAWTGAVLRWLGIRPVRRGGYSEGIYDAEPVDGFAEKRVGAQGRAVFAHRVLASLVIAMSRVRVCPRCVRR
jgi:hypothetical protein